MEHEQHPGTSRTCAAAVQDRVLDESRLDALRLMGVGALPLVDRIILSFLSGAPDSLAAITVAIEAGDPAELARAAHQLRGSAATLGATRVSDICGELEQRGREECLQGTRTLLASLARSVDDATLLLREQLPPAAR